ncbi:MAG: HD domain-containing protein [Elusimicrobiales bacterium]|nr:HD domain-containing protein [Elusimicrobiales bacterium]NLH38853.1 HD domain-containing protein [Elusimicrobiota bacterium]
MVYLLSSIIAFLLIILFIVLNRLYNLKLASLKNKKSSSPNVKKILSKFDELLLDMIAVHDSGIKGVPAGKEGEFYKMALLRACDIVGSDRGSIMIYNNDDGLLHIIASRGISDELVEKIKLKPGTGVAGRAFEKGEIIFVTNPEKNPDYDGYMGYDEQTEPFVAVPLKIKDSTVGVLNIHLPKTKNNFTDLELKFLSILAGEISIMAENINLYQSIEKFYFELVQTLAKTIDAKDSYTGSHAITARNRAKKLAERMNIPEKFIKNIEYAAILHDIGKIGIDDRIITKPAKLTDEEYAQIKKHPEIAYDILSPIEFLSIVAKIILYHHEWFNGNGYPEGLKAEEIPLGSRIISVIDAWDAMTSDRPYRKALKKEDAINELKNGAGKQFDPDVVDAFLKLIEEEE